MDMLNVDKIRADFPILSRKMNGKPLAYLDNAATTQKPVQVIEAMDEYYRNANANPHRGNYSLVAEATDAYEGARKNVANFIGAKPEEIIFTRNATEALNLVANATCQQAKPGSTVLLTQMEHHSNIVPWQLQAKKRKLRIEYLKLRDNGTLCNMDLKVKLARHPAIFSFSAASNVLGTANDTAKLAQAAKKKGALVCIDAAQAVPHMKADVKKIGCDFLAFSGHKMLGPTGIGVLYMRRELQEELEPFLGGGDMIKSVSFESASWNFPPYKYEAGTPNVAGAVGLSAAIDYLQKIGMEKIAEHEKKLAAHARGELAGIKGIEFYGPKRNESGIVSFNIGKMHAHDLGEFANSEGIAIRAGHLCAQPLMGILKVPAVARASFYLYNTQEEAGRLAGAMKKAAAILG